MSILSMLEISEQIREKGNYVVATYFLETGLKVDIIKKVTGIAVEQSTGTWLPIPEETSEIREKYVAKVIGIYEVPPYEFEVPGDLSYRRWIFKLAYPAVNFGPQIPMLLSTIIGNISMAGKLKLLDIEFPEELTKQFQGPKFGVQGIRKILGVKDRPLVGNMTKPCVGYTPEVGAKLFGKAAEGGVDLVKDDELISDPKYCPRLQRVKLYAEKANFIYEKTGHKVLYFVNITDRVDKILDNAKRAIETGANALMINYLTVGISGMQALSESSDINVPIMGHLNFAGTMYESHYSGMSSHLIFGKLARLAGADILVYPSPYGKLSLLRERYLQTAHHLLGKWCHFKPTFPMPGGAVMPNVVPAIIKDLGKDCIMGVGGAIHGHPQGTVAGAQAMRQAVDATMHGISLSKAAEIKPELSAAINAWGLIGEKEKELFDIK